MNAWFAAIAPCRWAVPRSAADCDYDQATRLRLSALQDARSVRDRDPTATLAVSWVQFPVGSPVNPRIVPDAAAGQPRLSRMSASVRGRAVYIEASEVA